MPLNRDVPLVRPDRVRNHHERPGWDVRDLKLQTSPLVGNTCVVDQSTVVKSRRRGRHRDGAEPERGIGGGRINRAGIERSAATRIHEPAFRVVDCAGHVLVQVLRVVDRGLIVTPVTGRGEHDAIAGVCGGCRAQDMCDILGLPRTAKSLGKLELRALARGLSATHRECSGQSTEGRHTELVLSHALEEAEVGGLDVGDEADGHVGNGLLRGAADRQRSVAVE